MNLRVVTVALLAFAISDCRKVPVSKDSSAPATTESPSSTLTPERLAELEQGQRAADRAEARDRAELIRPALPDFKAASERTKLALTLVLEKRHIKKGEPLRYRLEIRNAGRDSYTFFESPHSFIKDGSLTDTYFKALLKTPNGKTEELEARSQGMAQVYEFKLPNDRFMSDQQKDEAIAEMNREAGSKRALMITIKPGEALVTRSIPPGSGFRPLDSDLRRLKPGGYSLRFVYERPKLYHSDDLGIPIVLEMKSNEVHFEVLP